MRLQSGYRRKPKAPPARRYWAWKRRTEWVHHHSEFGAV